MQLLLSVSSLTLAFFASSQSLPFPTQAGEVPSPSGCFFRRMMPSGAAWAVRPQLPAEDAPASVCSPLSNLRLPVSGGLLELCAECQLLLLAKPLITSCATLCPSSPSKPQGDRRWFSQVCYWECGARAWHQPEDPVTSSVH